MKYTVFDIETNGLLDTVSKIHCLSYNIFDNKEKISSGTITDYKQIANFILNQERLVGHNIIGYDIPVLEKILNIKINVPLIDTLGISYYHYPISKFKHGLKYWGERLGFGKPVVEDWENQPIEVYIDRCEADVEINTRLFHFQMDYLFDIYENIESIERLIGYLNFKLDSLREQEEAKIKLDIRLAEKSKLDLEFIIEEKMSKLSKHMPRVVKKEQPKVMYKKDGSLSHYGEKWHNLLKLKGLPLSSTVITEPGNPASHSQLKEWLFTLGWKPKTFKVNPKGEKIPQVSLPFGGGLCPSITEMFSKYKFLEELGGLYRARHRLGLFKAFLESVDENGYIYAPAHGFTNTLRMQHSRPVANLPKVGSYYGAEVRGCLTVPDDSYLMAGSDISGLEDNTKQHFIYFYDPDYVTEMRVPGFDPHLDIGVLAGLITKEDETFYKDIERKKDELRDAFSFNSEEELLKYKRIKKMRGKAKVINFSATYGAGPPKIAETLKCSLQEATALHKTYWTRNAAVKKTAKACKVKTVRKQKWLYNPISGFWMFLKAEKDKFSTLNQSSGVYVFDNWLRKSRQKLKSLGIKVSLQYHDEQMFYFKKEYKETVRKILQEAINEVNQELGLNVSINIDTQFGRNYAEVH